MKQLYTILFIFFALLYGVAIALENKLMLGIIKPIPLFILIAVLTQNLQLKYNKLIGLGLIFSVMGDIILHLNYFVVGLGSFLIGHLFYIAAFWTKTQRLNYLIFIPFYIYGTFLVYFIKDGVNELFIPVVAYALVICTMGSFSVMQKKSTNTSKWAFAGAMLFCISDSILSIKLFKTDFFLSSYWIMLTYWAGQYLIYKSTQVSN